MLKEGGTIEYWGTLYHIATTAAFENMNLLRSSETKNIFPIGTRRLFVVLHLRPFMLSVSEKAFPAKRWS